MKSQKCSVDEKFAFAAVFDYEHSVILSSPLLERVDFA
jgi:hypothetical protein